MDWQTAAVIAIEGLAVAFLVQRMVSGRRPRARAASKPDVAASALVRRRR